MPACELSLKYKKYERGKLREFLKEHLSIQVSCDYDRCDTPQVTVSLYLDNEEISTSSDYL